MKLKPLKLDWDIKYEFILNNGSPVEPILIFEIPVKNRKVYMFLPFHDYPYHSGYILLLDTTLFLNVWRMSKNDEDYPNYHLGNEIAWRKDRKFQNTEFLFNQGRKSPVPVISGLAFDEDKGIVFSDSLTRTIWLLANGAEYLPVFGKTRQQAMLLQQAAGKTGCSIYACHDFLTHHFQTLNYQYREPMP